MGLDMRVIGEMTYSMALVRKYGQIILDMRGSILKERSMEEDVTFGQMDLSMMETGSRIELKGMVLILG